MGEALVIALLNAVVGSLLGTLIDNRLGTGTQFLTHVRQFRGWSEPCTSTACERWFDYEQAHNQIQPAILRRNARIRSLLAPYTRCNVCIA
jgi:hypothetical protein